MRNIWKLILIQTIPFVKCDEDNLRRISRNTQDLSLTLIETISGAGPDPSSIRDYVNSFKDRLGVDNESEDSQRDGYRDIVWDNPNIPYEVPGNYFQVSRGVIFKNDSTNSFIVSNTGGDDKFDTTNSETAQYFQAYSGNRMMAPLRNNVITFQFNMPGSNANKGGAVISAFGAVFVDVWLKDKTRMKLYDEFGNLIKDVAIEEYAEGLSFVGVDLGMPIIGKVELVLGSTTLDRYSTQDEVVVLDDIIFSEPRKFDITDLFP